MNEMQKMQRLNINARVKQIDQAIKSLRTTINRLDGARETPGVSIATFEAQVEKLIAEKLELTQARDVQDAVTEEVTAVQDTSVVEKAKTDSSQQRPAFEKPGKKYQDYSYEELFHENIDGDLILTFPDDVFKDTGWKEGDTLDFEVIHGNLHIRKRVNVNKK